MSNDYVNYVSSRRANSHGLALVLLFLGLAVALSANVYQYIKAERLAREVTQLQHNLQAQITRLSDATSGAFEVTQRVAAVGGHRESTDAKRRADIRNGHDLRGPARR